MAHTTFNRDAVLHALYSDPAIAAVLEKMQPQHLQEDLRQEVFVTLCAMAPDRLQALHNAGDLARYAVGVMMRMIGSDRSTFARTYRQELVALDEYHLDGQADYQPELEPDQCRRTLKMRVMEHALTQIHFYEAGMLKLLVRHGTGKRIAKKTGIPWRSVIKAISNGKANVRAIVHSQFPLP